MTDTEIDYDSDLTPEEVEDLDYILLNVSKNLWVSEDGFTSDKSRARVCKRPEALGQFLESCKANAADYNVPIRLMDILAAELL